MKQLHNLTKDGLKAYSFDYQKNSYFILGYDVGVQEGNIRKTMAARGLVNGRSPLRRSGRDLVFRCYPPELLSPTPKKTEADLLGQPPLICRSNITPLTIRQQGLLTCNNL